MSEHGTSSSVHGTLKEKRVHDHALSSIEEEDAKLRQLGIRRELRKEFTNFSTISFALGILGYVTVDFCEHTMTLDCDDGRVDAPRVLRRR